MKSPQNSPKPAETSPYLLGRQAYQTGLSSSACPFEGGIRQTDWFMGHIDAKKAAAAKKEAAR